MLVCVCLCVRVCFCVCVHWGGYAAYVVEYYSPCRKRCSIACRVVFAVGASSCLDAHPYSVAVVRSALRLLAALGLPGEG